MSASPCRTERRRVDAPSITAFLDYFEGIRARTRRVVDCVPPGRFDWVPAPERWSFADLVRHLAAIERFMFAENAAGRPSRYPGHGRELADGREAVLDYFERMHREAVAILSELDGAALERKCETPGGVSITTWKWLRAMVEHEIHHKAQLAEYLRAMGYVPPYFGIPLPLGTRPDIDAREGWGGVV